MTPRDFTSLPDPVPIEDTTALQLEKDRWGPDGGGAVAAGAIQAVGDGDCD